jgi:hypothetical protein
MRGVLGFAVGFVAGWAARSTVESSRGAAVSVATAVADMLERVKRAAAIEGDYLEDFVAEVRSRIRESRGWHESAANGNGGEDPSHGVVSVTDGRVP